jgi:Integrase core domain
VDGTSDNGFSRFHRVLSRRAWSGLTGSRIRLGLLLKAFVPDGPPRVIGMDDPLERRRGSTSRDEGIERDPVRSSRGVFVKLEGLRWLALPVLARPGFATRTWGLPFLTVLCRSERANAKRRRHQTVPATAAWGMRRIARGFAHRRRVMVGDGAVASLELSLTPWEEALVIELRRSLALPLDDIVKAMRRYLNPELSRSAIHRCLQRHGISARLTPDKAPVVAYHTDAPAGFTHIDVKYLPPLDRLRSYAYVAIDRATRFVYLEILPNRRAITTAGFLTRFPLKVHTILTDNGSEFTDRFAVDKKGKPHDKPSGQHPFDRACASHRIKHRLRPQTNGMVERFNRRLGEHLDCVPQLRAHRRFRDHAERDAYLHTLVADYNCTHLRCLDYLDEPSDLGRELLTLELFALPNAALFDAKHRQLAYPVAPLQFEGGVDRFLAGRATDVI